MPNATIKAARTATVQRLAQVFRDSDVPFTSVAAVAHVLRHHVTMRDAVACNWGAGTIALRVSDELGKDARR